ncbi:hypothetical protein K7B06_21365, partial [Streptomyces erythrochromogenes]|nr:hypothetical protein [Streptomyces erythrochromogenes]
AAGRAGAAAGLRRRGRAGPGFTFPSPRAGVLTGRGAHLGETSGCAGIARRGGRRTPALRGAGPAGRAPRILPRW